MIKTKLKYTIFFLMALVLLLLGIFYLFVIPIFYKPLLKETSPVILEVSPHSHASSLVEEIHLKTHFNSQISLKILIKILGISTHLKAGIYQINAQDTAFSLINKVKEGRVLILPFSIIEGTNIWQVCQHLESAPYLQYQKSDWHHIKDSKHSYEGLLLADTYTYEAGSEADKLIEQAHHQLNIILSNIWKNKAQGLPYKDAYELLIAASIIEKETGLKNERPLVSSVIVNRLLKKMPLQMDPTVIYAHGAQFNPPLSKKDLSIDSPYNTYRYRGLPPTPIAMVSQDALYAAAHPDKTDFLYFVATGKGTHVFSNTYDEQKKAVIELKKIKGIDSP